jgi:hypothetical protein
MSIKTVNSFAALKTIASSIKTVKVNNNQENVMKCTKKNNYGISAELVAELFDGYKQVEFDREAIRYDQWFLNRPVVRVANGEVINTLVICEAKGLIGAAKMENKIAQDAKRKLETKKVNMAKEATKAAKRLLNKEIKMEMDKKPVLKGMSDMEFKGNVIVCREEEITVVVKEGRICVSINKKAEKKEEVMVVETVVFVEKNKEEINSMSCAERIKYKAARVEYRRNGGIVTLTSDGMKLGTTEIITKGGFMNNDPQDFGPQRYCNCHAGIIETGNHGDALALDEMMDDYGVEYADDNSVTYDMERELGGSRTKLEEMEGGFFCPECGQTYDMSDCYMDGHVDGAAFIPETAMPNYSAFETEETASCRSLSIVVNDYTDMKQLKADILSECNGDLLMAENMAEMLVTETELDMDSTDGLGRGMISYVEEFGNGMDYDDDGEMIDQRADDNTMINVEACADKLIPWLGQTVNILGMLDIRTKANDKIIDGAFSRYYKTSHTKLAETIKEKAKLAQTNIISLRDTMVKDANGIESTVISEFDAKYLINELTYEYDYWMSWAMDEEWNGYKKHQVMRSNCIDHMANGGELSYYQYEDKEGKTTFGYHPATYVKEDTNYISHGGSFMVAQDNSAHLEAAVMERMSMMENVTVNAYEFKGNKFISMVLFDGATRIGAFSGMAFDPTVKFFNELVNEAEGTVITNNNYSLIKQLEENGAHVVSNLNVLINDLATYWGIEIDPTVSKQISSNKWLADLQFTGKDVESTVKVDLLNDYTDVEVGHDYSPINAPEIDIHVEKSVALVNGEIECSIRVVVGEEKEETIASVLHGHTNRLWNSLKNVSYSTTSKTEDMELASANVVVRIGDDFLSVEDAYYEELAEMAAMEDTLSYK